MFHRPFVPLFKTASKRRPRVIEELLKAKEESDRKNYRAKHEILRRLIQANPGAFKIDSEVGDIVGLTHQSGFRIHTKRRTLPVGLQRLSEGVTP